MYILPNQPQNILGICNTTFITFKKTFIKVLPITLFMIVCQTLDIFIPEEGALSLLRLVTSILFGISYLAFVYRIISLVIEGKKIDLWSIFKIGLKRFLPLIGLGLLMAVFISPAVFVYILGSELQAPWNTLALLFAIPYFIFITIKLYFSFIIISIPGKGVSESIKESSTLVSGNLLRTIFYLLILITILACLIVAIFSLCANMLSESALDVLVRVLFPLVPAGSVIVTQITHIYVIVMMNDLRQRKNQKANTNEELITVAK